jgi:hypothetical protein
MINLVWRTAGALALLAAVVVLVNSRATTTRPAAVQVQPSSPAITSATRNLIPGVEPTGQRAASALSPPASLTITSLGIQTALQPLGLQADGSLQPPSQWATAGWYDGGVVPGQIGPAIIAGHIDSTRGPAVFYRLRDLVAGAKVLITEQDGSVLTFVVDGAESFPKSQFPTAEVYGPTPDAELKLITCTGTFDSSVHSYRSNLVVTAHLTAST